MGRRSQFDFGGTTLVLDLPTQPWVPGDLTIGGIRVSGAGVPATYIVRRDATVALVVRIHEVEWPTLLALIAYGQAALPFLWYPDADDPTVGFNVYLDAPAPGEKWAPTRVADFPKVMEAALTLRGVVLAPWTPFFTA